MTVVVDTNVILVANRQHQDVSEACVESCTARLYELMRNGRIAIDDGYRILGEYQNKAKPFAGKRVGDTFLKWLVNNQANRERCERVPIVDHAERGFESFPEDDRLENFDRADRKFVAVAAALPAKPPILQAADSKWLGWSVGLADHGVQVEFLCPADIEIFASNKKRKGRKR